MLTMDRTPGKLEPHMAKHRTLDLVAQTAQHSRASTARSSGPLPPRPQPEAPSQLVMPMNPMTGRPFEVSLMAA